MSRMRRLRKQLKKKRKEQIFATVTATRDSLSITYDLANDRVEFKDCRVDSVIHSAHYDRQSGKEKVLYSIPSNGNSGHLNQRAQLNKDFDFLFAVDTNTRKFKDRRLSICVSFVVPNSLDHYNTIINISPFLVIAINDVSPKVNPELIGWHLTIEKIIANSAYNKNQRIGIIVDSELGKLPRINKREIHYYREKYLPENIQFIYASAEKGGEYFTNKMIRSCEIIATKIFDCLQEDDTGLTFQESDDDLFEGYRFIPVRSKPSESNYEVRIIHK